MVFLNLVLVEWAIFWNTLDAVSRVGFAVVSLGALISLTNKFGYLLNGGSPERRLTISMLAWSLLTVDWFFFESKDVAVLSDFSIVVLSIELMLYGAYHKFKSQHIIIFLVNLVATTLLRIFPNLGVGFVTVNAQVSEFFKVEAVLCWIVFAALAGFILMNKEKISANHKADKEAQWYGNLFSLISHNIRTPLATIIQTVDIIKLRSKKDELYFNEQLLERIDQSSNRATKLVNELLNKSTLVKLQAEEQTNMELFLNNWAKENNNSIFTPAIWMRETPISRHEQLSFYITLDVLLNNSLQAGSNNIHICSYEEGTISVIDDGAGMTDELLSNYGKPVSNSKNGAGLGTFFAKEILANSGWIIDAKQVEKGARIDIYRAEELIGQALLKSI